MINFRRAVEGQVCKYTDMISACNETSAKLYAYFYQKSEDIWNTASCGTLFSYSMFMLLFDKPCNVVRITSFEVVAASVALRMN